MSDLHSVVRRRLANVGQRYTRSRQVLVDTLSAINAPATMTTILEADPAFVQSSTYRNLSVLLGAGLVTKVDVGEERAYYELSEVLTSHHHHHLVCRGCGSVADITLSQRVEDSIEREMCGVANDVDFQLEAHRLDLIGVCADCRAA